MDGCKDKIDDIRNYLANEFELDDNDIAEMLNEFIINMDSLLSKALAQFENQVWKDLRNTAHSMKGASSNIGAREFASIAKTLETEALNANAELCAKLILALKNMSSELKSQIPG